jgi:hypothetical protein
MLRKEGRRHGRRLTYPQIAGGGSSGSGPPRLSDITWNQPTPLDPNARDATRVGWADPVGGLGPFWFTTDSGLYRMTKSDVTGLQDFSQNSGSIGQVRTFPGYTIGPGVQTFTITCIDGRGDTVSKLVTVAKATTSPVVNVYGRNQVTQCSSDTYRHGPSFYPNSSNTTVTHWTLTNSDGSATPWQAPFGIIYAEVPGRLGSAIPLGRQDLILNGKNSANVTVISAPFVFDVSPQPTGGYMEVNWNRTVSTSTLAQTQVATVAATTPNLKVDSWTLSDPSGLLGIFQNVAAVYPLNGIIFVRNQPTTPGPIRLPSR